MNTYKITLLALLAAMAVAGRLFFIYIPNMQPVTAIIIICGLILGPVYALILAFLITFLSNMLLGMGIWTIWQIVSWGLIGVISGLLGKFWKNIPTAIIILFGIFSGYLYGFIISLTTYQVAGVFWPYYLAGLPFDTNHAIGNALFLLILYPTASYLLKRYATNHFI